MEKTKEGWDDKLFSLGTKIALAGAILIIGNKYIKQANKTRAELEIKDKPEGRYAMLLRSAMNPSGFDWLFNVDGTNTDEVFKVAKQIGDLSLVQRAYSAIYKGDDLLVDLQKELSPDDYSTFLNITTQKVKNNTTYRVPASPGGAFFKYQFGTSLYVDSLSPTYGQIYKAPAVKPIVIFTQHKRGGLLGKVIKKHVLQIIKGGQTTLERWYEISNIEGQPRDKTGYVRESEVK